MELFAGCWHEAQRAEFIAAELKRIHTALYPDFSVYINTVVKEVHSSSRLLRDLCDLSSIYTSRTPMITYHLEVILPCLCKTLMDMKCYVCRPDLSPAAQWLRMSDQLKEQGGMSLWHRFIMYNGYLVQLVRLLSRLHNLTPSADWAITDGVSRSLLFDPTTLDLLRIRILRLRYLRGIPGMRSALMA